MNSKSPRCKTLVNPAMPSPMGTKELNCDWLGLAPENAKFRLLTDTLLTLSGPISMPRVSLLDSAGTGSGEGPEINDLEETLLKYEFRDGQPVWIKIDSGFWVRGHISGKQRNRRQIARTRTFEAFWPVVQGNSKLAWFSPANGDIKPDTHRVRELLRKEYDLEE